MLRHKGCKGVFYIQADYDPDWGWMLLPCCTIHGGPLSDSEIVEPPKSIYSQKCSCGHSRSWHGGEKHLGQCHRGPEQTYGKSCLCRRFEEVINAATPNPREDE